MVKFEYGKFKLEPYNPTELNNNFPFLENKVITGKLISMYKDGRIIKINKDFKFKLIRVGNAMIGEILEPNPIEALGLPTDSYYLVSICKFEKESEKLVYPIAENILLKGSAPPYFDEEINRILREEELNLILEGTVFHPHLERCVSYLKEALISFNQEIYPNTKTSCRKVLEEIKGIASKWKTVDCSESLCEKLKSVINSLYSFASIGGPHKGVATKEEAEFILKTTASLLFYVNSLLKNQRVSESSCGDQQRAREQPSPLGQVEEEFER
jgi:hypothetical protein